MHNLYSQGTIKPNLNVLNIARRCAQDRDEIFKAIAHHHGSQSSVNICDTDYRHFWHINGVCASWQRNEGLSGALQKANLTS